jgi:glycosyltransferase involved in cell wall biosynthesis
VEGENGFLIPPNSSADLTERLSRLMNSEEMRQRFGQKSRELAAEKFSQSVVIEAVLSDLYGLESEVSLAASSEQRKWA